MKQRLWYIPVGVAAADQMIKASVRRYSQNAAIFEVPGLVQITHSTNTGAAFSMLSGHPFLLAVLSVLLLASIGVYVCTRMRLTLPARIAFFCMLGGGLGNLVDRIIYSGVTDYIRLLLFDFPIFNLADIAITVSIALLIALTLIGKLEESTEDHDGGNHRAVG